MMDSSSVTLLPRYLEQIRSIIRSSMGDARGTVYLFGSRARGNPRPTSDIDLAVTVSGNTGSSIIASLRENLENSTIPFTVDVVDLGFCDSTLSDEVSREGVVVWNG